MIRNALAYGYCNGQIPSHRDYQWANEQLQNFLATQSGLVHLREDSVQIQHGSYVINGEYEGRVDE